MVGGVKKTFWLVKRRGPKSTGYGPAGYDGNDRVLEPEIRRKEA